MSPKFGFALFVATAIVMASLYVSRAQYRTGVIANGPETFIFPQGVPVSAQQVQYETASGSYSPGTGALPIAAGAGVFQPDAISQMVAFSVPAWNPPASNLGIVMLTASCPQVASTPAPIPAPTPTAAVEPFLTGPCPSSSPTPVPEQTPESSDNSITFRVALVYCDTAQSTYPYNAGVVSLYSYAASEGRNVNGDCNGNQFTGFETMDGTPIALENSGINFLQTQFVDNQSENLTVFVPSNAGPDIPTNTPVFVVEVQRMFNTGSSVAIGGSVPPAWTPLLVITRCGTYGEYTTQ
jgi:hypothetical protein